jgi:hypothetical protein
MRERGLANTRVAEENDFAGRLAERSVPVH